jgi:hypothetical protein
MDYRVKQGVVEVEQTLTHFNDEAGALCHSDNRCRVLDFSVITSSAILSTKVN